MKTRIVRIGNSQGIRIPKPILDQSGLSGDVDIEVRHHALVIRPARRQREGWNKAFRDMAKQGDDLLLDETTGHSSWDKDEWQWQ